MPVSIKVAEQVIEFDRSVYSEVTLIGIWSESCSSIVSFKDFINFYIKGLFILPV